MSCYINTDETCLIGTYGNEQGTSFVHVVIFMLGNWFTNHVEYARD
jgi:hypothetical protein